MPAGRGALPERTTRMVAHRSLAPSRASVSRRAEGAALGALPPSPRLGPTQGGRPRGTPSQGARSGSIHRSVYRPGPPPGGGGLLGRRLPGATRWAARRWSGPRKVGKGGSHAGRKGLDGRRPGWDGRRGGGPPPHRVTRPGAASGDATPGTSTDVTRACIQLAWRARYVARSTVASGGKHFTVSRDFIRSFAQPGPLNPETLNPAPLFTRSPDPSAQPGPRTPTPQRPQPLKPQHLSPEPRTPHPKTPDPEHRTLQPKTPSPKP